ncbi:hypothetical protein BGZ65_003404 [Modicella reniformis]|uniref:Uncharacterized protein n=1 Tax=Modicella reniformis TaxID=1440133 RepID=A0A9P6MHW9_9FUNG|nr:hypothetical protein BGZ65_003404 [Modicella reniformis]
MSVTTLWENFRSDPSTEGLFHPDSHIVFLPTGAGAATEKQVQEFYKTGGYSHSRKLLVEERVIHRTVGESSAVDEVEVTAKFVSGSGGWLLPGIAPHHLEDLTITFPLNKITSVRYFWDNASVLKMVKLIGSRHSWPIVTETQIEALRDPSRFRLNPFGSATGARPATGISQIFNTPPTSPIQQLSKKGHSALTSTVFSHLKNVEKEPDQEERRINSSNNTSSSNTTISSPSSPSSPSTKKGNPALTSTLFDHLKKPDNSTTTNNINSSSNASTISTITTTTTTTTTANKGNPALTSTLFNHLKEQPFEKRHTSAASVTPVTSQPLRTYQKTSYNIFGIPPEEQAKAKAEAEAAAAATQHMLQPSAIIDAELERNEEYHRELKGDVDETEQQLQDTLETLKQQIRTHELLNSEEKEEEKEEANEEEQKVTVETPAPAPVQEAQPVRKIHPNYRTSFTIGGPSPSFGAF